MNKSKYTSETTVDLQYNETMEKLYSKYGEEMMKIEGLSVSDLDTCHFFEKFLSSGNVADASIDDNANVTSKNISTMLSEAMKPHTKMLSRNKIYIEMKQAFGKEVADDFLEQAINGGVYEHDSHLSSYTPYCYAFSLENIVEKGLYFIDEMKAGRPKHLDTFNHHVLEFVSFATNQMAK